MRKIVVFLIFVLVPAAVQAQAFGVQMGAPASRYGGKHTSVSPYQFELTVPSPNGEFEAYVAYATPQTGICKVVGLGRTHTNDDYGSSVQSTFRNFTNLLAEKYGKSRQFDFIRAGALWTEPREWVWSIYKNERTLAAYWTLEGGSALPANVEAIVLDTRAVNTSGAYLTLTYEFANYPACKGAFDHSDSSGL